MRHEKERGIEGNWHEGLGTGNSSLVKFVLIIRIRVSLFVRLAILSKIDMMKSGLKAHASRLAPLAFKESNYAASTNCYSK